MSTSIKVRNAIKQKALFVYEFASDIPTYGMIILLLFLLRHTNNGELH